MRESLPRPVVLDAVTGDLPLIDDHGRLGRCRAVEQFERGLIRVGHIRIPCGEHGVRGQRAEAGEGPSSGRFTGLVGLEGVMTSAVPARPLLPCSLTGRPAIVLGVVLGNQSGRVGRRDHDPATQPIVAEPSGGSRRIDLGGNSPEPVIRASGSDTVVHHGDGPVEQVVSNACEIPVRIGDHDRVTGQVIFGVLHGEAIADERPLFEHLSAQVVVLVLRASSERIDDRSDVARRRVLERRDGRPVVVCCRFHHGDEPIQGIGHEPGPVSGRIPLEAEISRGIVIIERGGPILIGAAGPDRPARNVARARRT